MFEKEAKKWVKEHTEIDYKASYGEFSKEPSAIKSFKAGAEFGYNKCFEQIRKIVNEGTRLDCIIPELLRLQESE